MLGFETIGNATVIAHDGRPVVCTDPWLGEPAYFGSWGPEFEIPDAQREHILACPFVWFSHGHPDHLNTGSLEHLSDKTVLLPDHVGGRIDRDLTEMGFTTRVLPDREWVELSPRVKVMSVSDYYQDALLMLDVGGVLVVDFNDAVERGWGRFVRKLIRSYDRSFMLKLFGFGDADMINIRDEQGQHLMRTAPTASDADRLWWEAYFADKVAFWARWFDTTYLVPFSCFHQYQRSDSIWAQVYTTPVKCYDSLEATLPGRVLPPFISYDCEADVITPLNPARVPHEVFEPSHFGDDWSETLEPDEAGKVESYFRDIGLLHGHVDFLRLMVGGKTHEITLDGRPDVGRGLTFEVPRGSLLKAVEWQVFDDLLIGNFMKTTIHGDWGSATAPNVLYEHFTPWIARYADQAAVRTEQELKDYMAQYRQRHPLEHLFHRFEHVGVQRLRGVIRPGSPLFKVATKTYAFLKR